MYGTPAIREKNISHTSSSVVGYVYARRNPNHKSNCYVSKTSSIASQKRIVQHPIKIYILI